MFLHPSLCGLGIVGEAEGAATTCDLGLIPFPFWPGEDLGLIAFPFWPGEDLGLIAFPFWPGDCIINLTVDCGPQVVALEEKSRAIVGKREYQKSLSIVNSLTPLSSFKRLASLLVCKIPPFVSMYL